MGKFRKKPVVIEAVQWKGHYHSILEFIGAAAGHWDAGPPEHIMIYTLEGRHKALPGDWIIKGIKGEFYPCKPDIFEMTYEQVD